MRLGNNPSHYPAMAQLPFCLPFLWLLRANLNLITFLLPVIVPRKIPAALLLICFCMCPPTPPVPTLAKPLPSPLLHFTCLVQILLSTQMLTCPPCLDLGTCWAFMQSGSTHQHLCLERTIHNSFPFFVWFFFLINFNALVLCFEPWTNIYRMFKFFVCSSLLPTPSEASV